MRETCSKELYIDFLQLPCGFGGEINKVVFLLIGCEKIIVVGRQLTVQSLLVQGHVEKKLALGYFIWTFHSFSLFSDLSSIIATDPITFSQNESHSLNIYINKLPLLSHLLNQ